MPNRIGAVGPAVPAAVPATFAQYMREHDIPHDHPNLDGWRALWQQELQAEQHKPTSIPPCPPWCRLPDGHDYPSVDGFGDALTFERQHVAFQGTVADVTATESNHFGEVTVGPLEVFLDVRSAAYSVSAVRAAAAELVQAADAFEAADMINGWTS
jgi:hypothetical protein